MGTGTRGIGTQNTGLGTRDSEHTEPQGKGNDWDPGIRDMGTQNIGALRHWKWGHRNTGQRAWDRRTETQDVGHGKF